MMKVVHVVSRDTGGAARAAIRINNALKAVGVESSILVLHKDSAKEEISQVISKSISWNGYKLIRKINSINVQKYNLTGRFYEGKVGTPLSKMPIIQKADIIHLHWVNDGMLTINEIRKMARMGKRIVWTMHDMFSFTAGCYYDGECGGYKNGCKDCPLSDSEKVKIYIKKIYTLKQKAYSDIDISFVGCSQWIANCAKHSLVTKGKNICAIPNPIDTNVFKRQNKNISMNAFNINTQKKIILFGAMSADSDPRKGFIYLQKALKLLDPQKYLLVIFGNADTPIIDQRFETIGIGSITSDYKLTQIYSLADVFVAPSLQENLSNAVMEALSCGTPVVAFDVGGMKDMIEHQITGYLARLKDVNDLAYGIEMISSTSDEIHPIVRDSVINRFSPRTIGMKYKEFYING